MAVPKGKKTQKGRHFFSDRSEQRRRNRKMQAYLHGDVRIPPSVHGRLSVQIGLIGIAVFVLTLVISYLTGGEAGAFIGAFGLIDIILCCLGIFQGLVGFSEQKRDPGPCRRGIAINLILLVLLALLFFGGLRS